MKVGQLVAAMVLRVGNSLERPLTWTELGETFNVTKDVVRHRLTRFKEKYNIIDSDVDENWNRNFLKEFTPENEKLDLEGRFFVPGDFIYTNNNNILIISAYPKGVYINSDDVIDSINNFTNHNPSPKNKFFFDKTPVSVSEPVPIIDSKSIQYLMTPGVLVVVRDGKPLSIDKSHKNFEKIKEALVSENWQVVFDLIDLKASLGRYSNGRVAIVDNVVTLDQVKLSGKISDRLVSALTEGNIEELDAIAKFTENCDMNPDMRVVTRIYDFMSHNDLRLDKNGNILAYKIVQKNYKDKYTGTMDNSPGNVVTMKRNTVNPKDTETCSAGLHVAAKSYLPVYGSVTSGDRILLCQIHPKDFVSIPVDYDSKKARVCEYLVLKDVTENFIDKTLDESDTISV